jgi:hypothetical protein
MAAEQNRSAETQRLLGGFLSKLCFDKQAPSTWLAIFQVGFFPPHCPSKIQKVHLFAFAQ